MRREDDTRQAQTQTDAADTSECLSIVLFILGVTSHPEWSARHGSAEGVASSAHARLWSVFIILFGCDFLRRACVREGGFKSAPPPRPSHQAVDDAFDVRLSEQKGASDWRGCLCVFMCVSINLSPQATYQPLPCRPNLVQPPP